MRLTRAARRQLPVLFDYGLPREVKPDTSTLLPFRDYYRVIVMLSGKDSIFALMTMLERGVEPEQIEIWHQNTDGRPVHLGGKPGLFEWPVSSAYVLAAGEALGIPVKFQWREGGIEREMLRQNERIQPCSYQLGDGTIKTSGGTRGEPSTRLMFPQVGSIENGRWCSPAVKMDVGSAAICGDPRFDDKNILIVTGERREESANRNKYATVERHKTTNKRRRVDHLRPVLEEAEAAVWDCLCRYRIRPHPCYFLGYSRCSCMTCVFCGRDEWATIRHIDPERFSRISAYEVRFGKTIQHGVSVIEQASRGKSFIRPGDEEIWREALSHDYPAGRFILAAEEEWVLPRGAFRGGAAGPS